MWTGFNIYSRSTNPHCNPTVPQKKVITIFCNFIYTNTKYKTQKEKNPRGDKKGKKTQSKQSKH